MGGGVPILGTVTKKCFIRQEGNKRFRIILTQGLNRQIRRMCEYFGYKVMKLTRVRIMNVSLGNLAVGKWRYLTPSEIDTINSLVSTSSKTEEASYNTEDARPIKGSKAISKKDHKPAEKNNSKKGIERSSKSKHLSKADPKKTVSKGQTKRSEGKPKKSSWKEFRKKSK
jgi:hypothetical protein